MDETKVIKKSLLINRILLSAILVILVAFVTFFGIICARTYKYVKLIQPVVNELQKIDYKGLQDTFETLEGFNNLDVEAITEDINNIDFAKISELIDTIDVDEIKEAMDGLSNASSMLEKVTEKVAPIIGFFNK